MFFEILIYRPVFRPFRESVGQFRNILCGNGLLRDQRLELLSVILELIFKRNLPDPFCYSDHSRRQNIRWRRYVVDGVWRLLRTLFPFLPNTLQVGIRDLRSVEMVVPKGAKPLRNFRKQLGFMHEYCGLTLRSVYNVGEGRPREIRRTDDRTYTRSEIHFGVKTISLLDECLLAAYQRFHSIGIGGRMSEPGDRSNRSRIIGQ